MSCLSDPAAAPSSGDTPDRLADFDRREIAGLPLHSSPRPGPPVLLLHELPGLSPGCIALARRLVAAGLQVHLPLLFGTPGAHRSATHLLQLCVQREFTLLALGQDSPVTARLRAIVAAIAQGADTPRIGVIGMCLSGGFALSLLAETAVVAAVTCQPSLPLPPWGARAAALSAPEATLAHAAARPEARVLGLRFSEDRLCPPRRFDTLRRHFGDRFEAIELPSLRPFDHATLTDHFRPGPHDAALARVIEFLRQGLTPAA